MAKSTKKTILDLPLEIALTESGSNYFCKNKKQIRFCAICIVILLLISCSDTVPSLDTVKAMVLYDYKAEQALPQMRMGVFVQLGSHAVRSESLTITFPDENYTWQIDNPVTVKDMQNGHVWLGNSHLLPAQGASFSPGKYRATYLDLASREAVSYFTLPIIPSADAIDKSLYTEKNIAVFDAIGDLLYYGLESNRPSDEIILEHYPNATTVRTVLLSSDGITGILEASRFLDMDAAEQIEESFNTSEGITE